MSAGTIRCGIIEGTDSFKPLEMCYDLMAEYFQRVNISIDFIPIPQSELAEIRKTGDDLPENMDAIWYPVTIGDFVISGQPTIRRMTNVHFAASGMILSPAPQIMKKPSLSFLYMEIEFSLAWITSLLVVSVVLWIASRLPVPNKRGSRRPSFADTVLANFLLFFYEPFSWVPRIVSWRLAAMVWLIATTVIYIDISSNLKSDFTDSAYDTIDNVDDLIMKRKTSDIYFLEGTDEMVYFQRKAKTEKKYAKLMEGIPESSIMSLVSVLSFDEALEEISTGKSLIVSSLNMQFILTCSLETVKAVPNAGKFYFSPSFENTLLVYPLSYNFSRSKIMEIVNQKIEMGAATRQEFPIFNEVAYALEIMKWRANRDGFSVISIVEIESLLSVYYVGSAAGGVLLLLEIAFKLITSLKWSWKRYLRGRCTNEHSVRRINVWEQ